jgi:gliding motility-associated-like protein
MLEFTTELFPKAKFLCYMLNNVERYIKITLILTFFWFVNESKAESEISNYSSGNKSFCIFYEQLNNDTFISVVNEVVNGTSDIVVSKHVRNKIIWSEKYDLNLNSFERAYGAYLDKTENAILIYGSVEPTHIFLVKININDKAIMFSRLIKNTTNNPSCRMYKLIKLRHSGDYVALGLMNYSMSSYLLRINSTNGNIIWSREMDYLNYNELVYSICEDNNNNLILGGSVLSTGGYSATITKINANDGNQLFTQTYQAASLDDCVYIPNSDKIVFCSSTNNKSGLIIFNTSTNLIEKYVYFTHKFQSRTINIKYVPYTNSILVGGYLNSPKSNMFFQKFDLNQIENCEYYTFKFIDYQNDYSDRVFLSYDSSNYYFVGLHSSNNSQLSDFLVCKTSFDIDSNCFDKSIAQPFYVNMAASSKINISFKQNINILNSNVSQQQIQYVYSKKCIDYCKPISKEVEISINKKIDTICYNQSYIARVNILKNNLNEKIDLYVYRSENQIQWNLIKLDSSKTDFEIELNYHPTSRYYMFISKSNCSFNDTQTLVLHEHTLSIQKQRYDTLICSQQNLNLTFNYQSSSSNKLKILWKDKSNNVFLDSSIIFDDVYNYSKIINLTVHDNCVKIPLDIDYPIWVSPILADRIICEDTVGCSNFLTRLIHPKTIGNIDKKTPFDWQWIINNNEVITTNSFAYLNHDSFEKQFEKIGKHQVVLRMVLKDGKICDSVFQNIFVITKPISNFTIENQNIVLDSLIRFVNQSKHAQNYQWEVSDGTKYNTYNPSHIFQDTGKYLVKLIAQNEYNCKDTSELSIRVNDVFRYFLPNAFSPNKDGINSLWEAHINNVESANLKIFDRWGACLFNSNASRIIWDGKYKDELCPQGTYLYMLKVKTYEGKVYYYKGIIDLIN